MPTCKLTKRFIDALKPSEKRQYYWDSEMKGFGLSLTPAGVRTYVVQYRLAGGRKGRTRR